MDYKCNISPTSRIIIKHLQSHQEQNQAGKNSNNGWHMWDTLDLSPSQQHIILVLSSFPQFLQEKYLDNCEWWTEKNPEGAMAYFKVSAFISILHILFSATQPQQLTKHHKVTESFPTFGFGRYLNWFPLESEQLPKVQSFSCRNNRPRDVTILFQLPPQYICIIIQAWWNWYVTCSGLSYGKYWK